MKFYLTHLGCKLNQAEIESISRRLLRDGHEPASTLEEAEVHIVNSCTVTHVAARDSRKVARRAARLGKALDSRIKTVLTGCYATDSAEEARGLEGVDLVVGNERKHQLVDALYQQFPEFRPGFRRREVVGQQPIPISYAPLDIGYARGALKIDDGCNMRCAFCIIPHTRGRQQSRPSGDVIRELRQLTELGYREVVVTGVQISSYRHSDGHREVRLTDLVTLMIERTSIERLRLTSIAPWQFDPRLLELFPTPRLCRHFHLSLQSGCSETLRAMRRPYEASVYRELVARIRAAVPGVAITTDVIVGFPGETDRRFEESCDFVREMEFARCHVFTYSARPGTLAAELPDSVPQAVKKRRSARMLEVARDSEHRFHRSQLDTVQRVLWENERDGTLRGTTDNYLRSTLATRIGLGTRGDRSAVAAPSVPAPGHITPVRIVAVQDHGVTVELEERLRIDRPGDVEKPPASVPDRGRGRPRATTNRNNPPSA